MRTILTLAALTIGACSVRRASQGPIAGDGTPGLAQNTDGGAMLQGDASGRTAPRPATPCGDDLDVKWGDSAPDVGALPPPATFTGSPSENGPFAVSALAVDVPIRAAERALAGQDIRVSAGSLRGTGYVPSGAGPFPLVLVLPGFQASYTFYEPFSRHLASHGFCVLGVDTRSDALVASHDKEAVEASQSIDFALSDAGPCAGKVDASKVVVAGHSKGGKVAFYTAALDARVDLVLAWDPVNAGGGPCAFDSNCNALPVAPNCTANAQGVEHLMRAESLVIGAPPDALLNPDANHNAANFYRGAPSPASFVELDTGHIDWVPALADPDTVRITKSVQLAVLLRRFRNVSGLEGWLPQGAQLQQEAQLISARTK